jgi:hypothetical protein
MDIVCTCLDERELIKMKKVVTDKPDDMKTGIKGVLLVIGAYIVTFGVAICIIVPAIMNFVDTTNCGAVGRALPVLWGTIAMVFLASVIVVGVAVWKVISGIAGRLVVVAAYGVAMLVTYVGIAFGLMVVLNC